MVLFAIRAELHSLPHPCWRTLVLSDGMALDRLARLLTCVFGWRGTHTDLFALGTGWEFPCDAILDDGLEQHVACMYVPDAEERPRVGDRLRVPARAGDAWPWESSGERLRPVRQQEVRLRELLPRVGDTALWRYDMADDWVVELSRVQLPSAWARRYEQHHPMVTSMFLAWPRPEVFLLADGAGGSPPDDVGGPTGYAQALERLADPRDPEHPQLRCWFERQALVGWGPDGYDPVRLQRLLDVHEGLWVRSWLRWESIGDGELESDLCWLDEPWDRPWPSSLPA